MNGKYCSLKCKLWSLSFIVNFASFYYAPFKDIYVLSLYRRGGEVKVHESEAFRKWFRYLGELRSLCPQANILAVKKIKNHVSEVLGLDPVQTTEVTICPNKSIIKLVVKKVDKDIEAVMYWLMESLNSLREAFPRTLIYCNSISDVSKLYNYIVREIVECAKFIDMYHSETPDENKKLIVEALRTKSSEKESFYLHQH